MLGRNLSDKPAFVPKRHRELGRRARDRAMKRAGKARITDQAWAPEIDHLTELGLSTSQVAGALNLSVRRVREIKQYVGESGLVIIPDAKDPNQLSDEAKSYLDFTPEAFKAFYERFSGYTLPPHCLPWVEAFCTERNLMLNVPPRHMKSSIFSLWIPVWLLCRDRDERILLVSLTKESAKKWVSGIAEQLSVNDEIVSMFGRFKPLQMGEHAWRPLSGTLMVSGRQKRAGVQYSVESRGSNQQILGMEATVCIIDDVSDRKISESDVARTNQLNWLQGEVLSRIETQQAEAQGRAVIVAQRVHHMDIYGTLENQVYERGPRIGDPLWKTLKSPAILRWPDEDPENPEPLVLWPEKWTYEELMVTYERVGGHNVFSAMYQQQPLAEGSDVFRPEWLVACRDYDRSGGDGVRAKSHEAVFPVVRVLSIDPSVRQYHGLVVCDIVYDKSRFFAVLVELKRWKGTQRSIIDEIDRVLHTYRPDYFVFEDVSFIQWLKEDPYYQDIQRQVKVLPHQTNRNKGDQEMGLESLAREVEFGYIRTPYGDAWGREMTTALETEMTSWPHGRTTDLMMALWFVKWNYKRLIPYGLTNPRLKWMPDKADGFWRGFERRKALV